MKKIANEKIGQFVQRVMSSTQLKNAEILELVGNEFPEAKTTSACIAWYRSDLKKKPQVRVETLETIDLEIKQAEDKLEALKAKREEFKATNAEKLKARKAELEAELAAMQDVE